MVPCSGGKDIRLCHIDTPLISVGRLQSVNSHQVTMLYEYFNNFRVPLDKTAVNRYVCILLLFSSIMYIHV